METGREEAIALLKKLKGEEQFHETELDRIRKLMTTLDSHYRVIRASGKKDGRKLGGLLVDIVTKAGGSGIGLTDAAKKAIARGYRTASKFENFRTTVAHTLTKLVKTGSIKNRDGLYTAAG